MIRRIFICVAVAAATASGGHAAEPGIDRPPFLPPDAAVLEVLDASPPVALAQGRLSQARAEARQLVAGEHETTFTATFDDRRVRGDGDYSEWSGQLSRGLRLPGKGRLDRAAGMAGVRAAEDAVEDARHQASLDFVDRWVRWMEASERHAIDAAEAETYAREVQALKRRVELKDAALLELQEAQGAEARTRAALVQSAGLERRARVELVSVFPGLVPPATATLPPPSAPRRAFDRWAALIVERSHEISMARAEADREETLARRARLDRAPDPTIGVRTFSERGGDETGVGVFVSIPFSGPRRSAVADRQAGIAAQALARHALVSREIRATADTDVVAAEAALAAWHDAETARAASEVAAARITRAYQLGERDLSDRLLAERQAFEARRFELAARAEAHRTLLRMALDAHELWLSEED
ncbi:TolC family protein [Phenylobacterium kunshanense]|uniref:Transporter n=1 Tax=Phenylobacterium kunshanense TaxID=1445034 RepID=A0A328BG75_9CAUL|nr:TolC family protein [Phenylobacterium kunshanense]RAK66230.1 transporter [Phenylobacterium kunshanense]